MLKQLKPEQRKRLYTELRERLVKKLDWLRSQKKPVQKDKTYFGFCHNVDVIVCKHKWTRLHGYDTNMMGCEDRRELRRILPELAEYKPKNMYGGGYWFSITIKGLEKRISILDKILEKMS